VIVILFFFPVALSRAETLRIPLASISKETSIYGTPHLAGGIPSKLKSPNLRLSFVIGHSPSKT